MVVRNGEDESTVERQRQFRKGSGDGTDDLRLREILQAKEGRLRRAVLLHMRDQQHPFPREEGERIPVCWQIGAPFELALPLSVGSPDRVRSALV